MYPISDRFQAAVRQPHRMVAYADLLLGTGETVTGKVTDGSVSIDRTADVRRTASLDLATWDMASTLVDRLKRVNPYTTRLQVYRGIRYGDGVEEIVPLGRFWIDDLSWGQDDSLLSLSCSDQAAVVQRATMPFRRIIKGQSTLAVISALLAETYSAGWNELQPSSFNLIYDGITDEPLDPISIEDDRWAIASGLAAGLGADLWANYDSDDFRLTPTPDLSVTEPVFTVNGGERGVLVDYSRSLSREGVANSVIVRAETATTMDGIWAVAEDTDPNSDTYVGRYGRSVLVVEDNLFNTTAKCQRAAEGILANSLGLTSNLDLTAVPNPALDAGDVIEVAYPNGLRERHVIDALEIPLKPDGAMTIKTRSTTGRL